MTSWFQKLALAAPLVLFISACHEGSSPAPSAGNDIAPTDAMVARVGEATLSKEDLAAELRRRGPGVGPQEIVQEWLHFQATLAAAREAGYDRDPRLVRQWERLIVSQFQEDHLAQRTAAASAVTEAELEDYYRKHSDQFRIAEAVRAAVLCVRNSAKATIEKRRELAAEVRELRQQAAGMDAAEFAELVALRSEDQATRYRGGDVGWLTKGMAVAHWELPVVEAALNLSQPGDLSSLIQTDRGCYVIRLLERRPAGTAPLEEVRELVRHRLVQDRQRRQQQDFVRSLQAGLAIQVNQGLIDSLNPCPSDAKPSVPTLPGE